MHNAVSGFYVVLGMQTHVLKAVQQALSHERVHTPGVFKTALCSYTGLGQSQANLFVDM